MRRPEHFDKFYEAVLDEGGTYDSNYNLAESYGLSIEDVDDCMYWLSELLSIEEI